MTNIGGLHLANALLAQTVRLNLNANRASLAVPLQNAAPQDEPVNSQIAGGQSFAANIRAASADERLGALQDASRDSHGATAALATLADVLGRMQADSENDTASGEQSARSDVLAAQLRTAANAAHGLLNDRDVADLTELSAAGGAGRSDRIASVLSSVHHAQAAAAAQRVSLAGLVDGNTVGAVNRRAADASVGDIETARFRTAFTKEQLLTDVEGALRAQSSVDPSAVLRLFR